MNVEIVREFIQSNFQPLMLSVAGLSCGAGIALLTTLRNRRRDVERTDGWNLLPSRITDWCDGSRGSLRSFQITPGCEENLLRTLAYACKNDPERRLHVDFSEGLFNFRHVLSSLSHLCLEGVSSDRSMLVPDAELPTMTFERVRDCLVRGFTIDGGVYCSKSELTMRDCVLHSGRGCAGIEATDGSMVTFSGTIAPQSGGVAIRAGGRSCVILQPPYSIDENDTVLIDRGSKIIF
jgi:hypothetical protein